MQGRLSQAAPAMRRIETAIRRQRVTLKPQALPWQRPTLVVIDMQPSGFPYASFVRNEVAREIRRAIEDGLAVIIIEYDLDCAGTTDPRLIEIVTATGYKNWCTVKKSQKDGSAEVIQACLKEGYSSDNFRVVGVVTDECVKETVEGLLSRLPECHVEVMADAVTTWSGPRYDWSTFVSSPRLLVTRPS